jgi:hypothetical protein
LKEIYHEILITICQHTPFSFEEVSKVYKRIKTIDGVLTILEASSKNCISLFELTEAYLILKSEKQ